MDTLCIFSAYSSFCDYRLAASRCKSLGIRALAGSLRDSSMSSESNQVAAADLVDMLWFAMSRWQTFKLAQRLLATRELRLGGSGLRPESPDHDRTVTVTHGSVMVQRSQRQVWVTREILL